MRVFVTPPIRRKHRDYPARILETVSHVRMLGPDLRGSVLAECFARPDVAPDRPYRGGNWLDSGDRCRASQLAITCPSVETRSLQISWRHILLVRDRPDYSSYGWRPPGADALGLRPTFRADEKARAVCSWRETNLRDCAVERYAFAASATNGVTVDSKIDQPAQNPPHSGILPWARYRA